MRAIIISLSLTGLSVLLFQGCEKNEQSPLRIAFSKGSPADSYANYYGWINSIDSTVLCLDMYALPLDSAMKLFRGCSGLLLTGGTDINPNLYQNPGDTARCMTIDDYLDQLEMMLVDSAMARGMPILGICRGHQMLNVAFGGTLIIDIPSDFDTTVQHRCEDFTNCFHPVDIDNGSMLHEISGLLAGNVNSNHHQGIKKLAPGLNIVAFSPDSLPEAVEWANPGSKPFLLGVQWHPERLGNDNPLSGKIGARFVEECRKFR